MSLRNKKESHLNGGSFSISCFIKFLMYPFLFFNFLKKSVKMKIDLSWYNRIMKRIIEIICICSAIVTIAIVLVVGHIGM